MAVPSPAALAKQLRLLDENPFILGPWDHAALVLLERRGHAKSEYVYMPNGKLARSKLWSITPAGHDWRAGQ
jgi:hypothetical protein